VTSVDERTSARGDDNHHIATGSNDRSVKVWDSRCRKRDAELTLVHDCPVLDFRFGASEVGPDTIYSFGIDPRIHVWNTRKPSAPVYFLDSHADTITGMDVSLDGSHPASHGADERVVVGGQKKRLDQNLCQRFLSIFFGGTCGELSSVEPERFALC
jgi:WD40 repeat protein